jgi:hypothetical protein
MKNVVAYAVIVLSAILFACQDSKDEASSLPDLSAYKTVGMKIPTELGARWIQAYNQKYDPAGRLDGILYSLSSTQLQQLLSSVDNLIGVAFQYGLDDSGNKHIIVIPVDNTMRLWNFIEGRLYVDANTGAVITKGKAEQWSLNFQKANPDAIWFHYFGRNIFDEIVTLSDFTSLDIIPAINDLDFSPQLLLVVGNSSSLLGRTGTETTTVYDASYPCPKCDVQ